MDKRKPGFSSPSLVLKTIVGFEDGSTVDAWDVGEFLQ